MLGADHWPGSCTGGQEGSGALGYGECLNANAGALGQAHGGQGGREGFYELLNVVIEIDHKNRVHLNRV